MLCSVTLCESINRIQRIRGKGTITFLRILNCPSENASWIYCWLDLPPPPPLQNCKQSDFQQWRCSTSQDISANEVPRSGESGNWVVKLEQTNEEFIICFFFTWSKERKVLLYRIFTLFLTFWQFVSSTEFLGPFVKSEPRAKVPSGPSLSPGSFKILQRFLRFTHTCSRIF